MKTKVNDDTPAGTPVKVLIDNGVWRVGKLRGTPSSAGPPTRPVEFGCGKEVHPYENMEIL